MRFPQFPFTQRAEASGPYFCKTAFLIQSNFLYPRNSSVKNRYAMRTGCSRQANCGKLALFCVVGGQLKSKVKYNKSYDINKRMNVPAMLTQIMENVLTFPT